jgi:hypothetical protein
MTTKPAACVLSDPRETGEMTPIADLLANASQELRRLCASAYEVEAAVGALITGADPASLAEIRGLQELDRLIQHIDGLAAYIGALAEASDGLGHVDAGRARRLVKVARLADGLAGRAHQADDGIEML